MTGDNRIYNICQNRCSLYYSFTPPAVMPAMKYLWNIANRITIGMTENTAPTIRRSNMGVHYLGPASHNHAISAGMKSDERKNPFASIFFEFSQTAFYREQRSESS